ncbi:peptidoglycan DD-metalloendopeptidase family protein [Marinitoga sp. 38H-ov]|uniref:peptidoglycan DD-metalloendopeptidase family protein n=1 Tax=Marinitoga sp. 38H-ov TaxID=1755814 RepID=UPI0013EE0877|nr:peptidoglycan DD-metalloendopeptidase family protein [Marinitoga sp. 38H-ov]KAF2956081.1 hypothetical protein AS160_07925 [Marinitoga sp. 38H-ov]
MKKIVLFLSILFIFTSCSLFQMTPTNDRINNIEKEISSIKLTLNNQEQIIKNYYNLEVKFNELSNEISLLKTKIESFDKSDNNKLINLENQLTDIENSIVKIKNDIPQIKDYNEILSAFEKKINDIEKNIQSLNNENAKKEELNILNDSIESLNSSITNIETNIYSLKSNFSTFSLDFNKKYVSLEGKINTLENNYSSIGLTIDSSEIQKKIDDSVKYNIDALLKTVNSLDKIWQINFETLEKDLDSLKNDYSIFKENVSGIINEENLKKYVYESVETETQREVAKLFYKTKSEELLKIKNLEEQFNILNNNISKLQNSFELLSSRPLSTLDEKYKTKLAELERELTNALISFSNAEIKELFGSGDQIIYKVKSGDTLSQIALAFGLGYNGVDLIKVANNIDDPRTIRVGQDIIIPVNNIEEFLSWPLEYTSPSDYERIVIRFGDRISTGISVGLGILPLKDENVKSVLPGRIIEIGKSQNDSNYIKIDHGNGVITVYSNLISILIKEGKWVDSNTVIGKVQKDKLFNFEIWKNGEPKDPMRLFFKYIGNFKATFYTEWDDKIIYYPAFRLTKSQNVPRPWVTVAADPNYLPLGTIVYIPEFRNSPNFGFFEIEDIGGKIIGNRLDIYINDVRLAQNSYDVDVYIVGQKTRR